MIEFVQYLRPHGRRTTIAIDRPAAVARDAKTLVRHGARLEAEVLTTGAVSLTVETDDAEGEVVSLAHQIVPNGPGMGEAVDRLIRDAMRALAKR